MIEVLSVVYGDSYLNLFKGVALFSLAQPKNKSAIRGARFNVFTKPEEFDAVRRLLDPLSVEVNLIDVKMLRDRIDPAHSALCWQIGECIKNKSSLFICPPDTFFVDGSLENLFAAADTGQSCVALAHPRVKRSILNDDISTPTAAVDATFRHLHKSWADAEIGHQFQNMYYGGVEWAKINKMYLVTHLLPTVYLCKFTEFDKKYFELAPCFGVFDHEWPRELYKQNRLSAIGSSDFAYCFELTDDFKNVPPYLAEHPRRDFWREFEHNKMYKGFRFVLRGS